MNDTPGSVIEALDTWNATAGILIQHLAAGDEEAAQEALTILLMQGLGLFGGPESVMMQQAFPVLDGIKTRIDLGGALSRGLEFQRQIGEVRSLVLDGLASQGEPKGWSGGSKA
jgi:hypothetical protein